MPALPMTVTSQRARVVVETGPYGLVLETNMQGDGDFSAPS